MLSSRYSTCTASDLAPKAEESKHRRRSRAYGFIVSVIEARHVPGAEVLAGIVAGIRPSASISTAREGELRKENERAECWQRLHFVGMVESVGLAESGYTGLETPISHFLLFGFGALAIANFMMVDEQGRLVVLTVLSDRCNVAPSSRCRR
jgi:hypothetical protein